MEMNSRSNGIIILIDALEMRRACTVSALEPWARSLSLTLLSFSPKEMGSIHGQFDDDLRLVIFNIGGASVADLELHEMLMTAKATFRGPYAVICERLHPDDAVFIASLGFQGFLPAILPLDLVKQALDFIINGGSYYPREVLLAPFSSTDRHNGRHHGSETPGALTQRQHEVLDRLRLGKSNKHIARELNMQEATVKVHVRQIMRKLGAANRTQAALLAQSNSLSPAKSMQPLLDKGVHDGLIPPIVGAFGDGKVIHLPTGS